MLNIDEYYLGVIIAHPSYFTNPKSVRVLYDTSFDPFQELNPVQAVTIGVPTLLHKVEDIYYDEYHSRWNNELGYKLGEINSIGITLAYVKPFKEYYPEKPCVYIKEEVENNPLLMERIFFDHSYYIAHSKLNRRDAIITLDQGPTDAVRIDYLNDLLRKSNCKEFIKK